jgi:hypothetical protein
MSNQTESTSEAYIFKEFLLSALSYKYLYIVSFIIFMALAFMINKFSQPVYSVNSIIGPVEDKASSLLGSNNLFTGWTLYPRSGT